MDWATALPFIAALTQDLTTAPLTPADSLLLAQQAIVQAILSGQDVETFGLVTTLQIEAPPAVDDPRALNYLQPPAGSTPLSLRCLRRDFALSISPEPGLNYTVGAGQNASVTYGPFFDRYGRIVALDVFNPINVSGLQFLAADPYFYISAPLTFTGSFSATTGEGSVWIAAKKFVDAAPNDAYVGLRIASGAFTYDPNPAGPSVTLKLQLSPSLVVDGFSSSVVTPAQISLTFTSSGATLTSASDCQMTALDIKLNLHYSGSSAYLDSTYNRLNFPMQADLSTYQIDDSSLNLVSVQGQAVLNAAWSLPVTVTTTKTFSDASGAGGFALLLNPGITILPRGQDRNTICQACVLFVDPLVVSLGGNAGRSTAKARIVTLEKTLADAETKSTLTFRSPESFPFRYVLQSNGDESWGVICLLVASLDQPRIVSNTRVPFSGPAFLGLIRDQNTNTVNISVIGINNLNNPNNFFSSMLSFAIRNLFFKTENLGFLAVAGIYIEDVVPSGTVTLATQLFYVLPILPDPYATNVLYQPGSAIDVPVIGPVSMTLIWTAEEPMALSLMFPPSFLTNVVSQRSGSQFEEFLAGIEKSSGIGSVDGPILLDLSTNVSQFGVSFSTVRAHESILDLSLQTTGSNLLVFALPTIQWEPMVTPDPLPPAPPGSQDYSFPYSGPPVKILSQSVTLVPTSPREAIDRVIANYNSTLPSRTAALFSLPFGIAAVVDTNQHVPGTAPPSFNQVQPAFTAAATSVDQTAFETIPTIEQTPAVNVLLTGGDQIAIRTPSSSDLSVALPGATAIIPMSLNGVSGDTTVLGEAIAAAFENDFRSEVPVNRIDISGFGASTFSHWQTNPPSGVGISKVYFDVFTGRTAREVIQMNSIIFPYGVRVVRTISIERANSGIVNRRDSGWQATSDGTYDIPHTDPAAAPIVTHPGVVLGVTQVTNIRDLSDPAYTMVNFDCTVQLESSSGTVDVPVRDQLGYIVTGITSVSGTSVSHNIPIPTPSDYATLLQSHALGGPLDWVIDVGGSGLKTRITSVSVSATSPNLSDVSSPKEFAMAAWGSPVLPEGQWSFTKKASGSAPQAVDGNRGVPLVRQGPRLPGFPPIPTSVPYSFADPSDLLATAKQVEYSILHATDSARLMFPQPEIFLGQLKNGITSKVPPILADTFALGTSKGIFPALENCLPLPDPSTLLPGKDYVLEIVNASKDLKFDPGIILPGETSRILQQDGNLTSIVQTTVRGIDPQTGLPNVPQLDLLIDTANKVRNFNLSNITQIAQNEVKKEVNRVIGDITSQADQLTKFVNPEHVFGEALSQVKSVVSFLDSLHILPQLKVSMTNEWSLEISTSMGRQDLLDKLPPGLKEIMAKIVEDLTFLMTARATLAAVSFIMKMHLTIKVPTSFGPTALGIAGFDLALSTATGLTLGLDLGVGIGVNFAVGPFEATAYYAQTQTIMKGQSTWGVGATVLVKAHVDIVVASADVVIEAKLLLISGTCTASPNEDTSIVGFAQVSVGIDVSIFWVVNVHVHESAEWSNNFKGTCTLQQLGAAV